MKSKLLVEESRERHRCASIMSKAAILVQAGEYAYIPDPIRQPQTSRSAEPKATATAPFRPASGSRADPFSRYEARHCKLSWPFKPCCGVHVGLHHTWRFHYMRVIFSALLCKQRRPGDSRIFSSTPHASSISCNNAVHGCWCARPAKRGSEHLHCAISACLLRQLAAAEPTRRIHPLSSSAAAERRGGASCLWGLYAVVYGAGLLSRDKDWLVDLLTPIRCLHVLDAWASST